MSNIAKMPKPADRQIVRYTGNQTLTSEMDIGTVYINAEQQSQESSSDNSEVSDEQYSMPPVILVDTDEYRVTAEVIEALSSDPDLYQQHGRLVEIREIPSSGSLLISPLPKSILREKITKYATLVMVSSSGEITQIHPSSWLVSSVYDRNDWPDIPHI